MFQWARVACVVASVFILQACAFVDQDVELGYTATGYHPSGAGVVVVGAPKSTFLNERNVDGRIIIGTVRNGFGAKTANVLAQSDPRTWIADALIAELELAGYDITRVDTPDVNDATRGLELSIRSVFVDQDPGLVTIGAISDLQYDIVLKSGATVVETIKVRYKADISERSLAGTGSLKAAALKEALEISLGREMPRILEALQSIGA